MHRDRLRRPHALLAPSRGFPRDGPTVALPHGSSVRAAVRTRIPGGLACGGDVPTQNTQLPSLLSVSNPLRNCHFRENKNKNKSSSLLFYFNILVSMTHLGSVRLDQTKSKQNLVGLGNCHFVHHFVSVSLL